MTNNHSELPLATSASILAGAAMIAVVAIDRSHGSFTLRILAAYAAATCIALFTYWLLIWFAVAPFGRFTRLGRKGQPQLLSAFIYTASAFIAAGAFFAALNLMDA